jgi:hypothetical protein
MLIFFKPLCFGRVNLATSFVADLQVDAAWEALANGFLSKSKAGL